MCLTPLSLLPCNILWRQLPSILSQLPPFEGEKGGIKRQETPHALHLSMTFFHYTFLKPCDKALEPALKLVPLSHQILRVAWPVELKKRKNAFRNESHDMS